VGVSDQQPVPEVSDVGDESRAVAEERERELAALNQVQGDLAAVDRTLAALDEGTYGTCEVCGMAIGDDVLERSPVARSCGAHDEADDEAHGEAAAAGG
jgi:RNA polymerase-binding transcription factor DksA